MQRGSSCKDWRLEQNSAVPVALADVRAAGAIRCSGRGRRGKVVFLLLETGCCKREADGSAMQGSQDRSRR